MTDQRDAPECIECTVTWLLFGDGAKCLAGHGHVYWHGVASERPPIPVSYHAPSVALDEGHHGG